MSHKLPKLTPATQALARLRACCDTEGPETDLQLAIIGRAIQDTSLGQHTNRGYKRTVFTNHTNSATKMMRSRQLTDKLQAMAYLKAHQYQPITDLLGIDPGYADRVIADATSSRA